MNDARTVIAAIVQQHWASGLPLIAQQIAPGHVSFPAQIFDQRLFGIVLLLIIPFDMESWPIMPPFIEPFDI